MTQMFRRIIPTFLFLTFSISLVSGDISKNLSENQKNLSGLSPLDLLVVLAKEQLKDYERSQTSQTNSYELPKAQEPKILKNFYPCPHTHCEKAFLSSRGLKKHLQYVHNTTLFTCTHDSCRKVFNSYSGCYNHIQSIHKKTVFPCTHDSCKKVFNSHSGRHRHLRIKHSKAAIPDMLCD